MAQQQKARTATATTAPAVLFMAAGSGCEGAGMTAGGPKSAFAPTDRPYRLRAGTRPAACHAYAPSLLMHPPPRRGHGQARCLTDRSREAPPNPKPAGAEARSSQGYTSLVRAQCKDREAAAAAAHLRAGGVTSTVNPMFWGYSRLGRSGMRATSWGRVYHAWGPAAGSRLDCVIADS
jgi:hypothetical protein